MFCYGGHLLSSTRGAEVGMGGGGGAPGQIYGPLLKLLVASEANVSFFCWLICKTQNQRKCIPYYNGGCVQLFLPPKYNYGCTMLLLLFTIVIFFFILQKLDCSEIFLGLSLLCSNFTNYFFQNSRNLLLSFFISVSHLLFPQ